jgi:trk system potassium uptake protein TrkH
MAITILPLLQVGGMQMFKVEAFEAQDKVFGRAAQIASAMVTLYMVFTFLLMMALIWAGMDTLDALNHAMTTIATGGFSTSDNSVGNFDSALIEMIITVGMILGSIPFILFLHAVKGAPQALYKDSQVHWFLGSLAVAVFSVGLWLHHNLDMTFHTALRYAAFNVTSIMTGSGFASVDYWQWGSFPVIVIFMLSFAGGCAGSTTCGIKIFRFQVMYATSKAQIRRLLQPHGVFIPSYNKRPIEKGVAEAVMGFFFLFALTIALLAMALSALGLDFITALSAAGTAVANVGPGLGDTVGPAGNFSTLPDTAKWLLSLGMLLGRLEIYTVLVLLAPSFWRN